MVYNFFLANNPKRVRLRTNRHTYSHIKSHDYHLDVSNSCNCGPNCDRKRLNFCWFIRGIESNVNSEYIENVVLLKHFDVYLLVCCWDCYCAQFIFININIYTDSTRVSIVWFLQTDGNLECVVHIYARICFVVSFRASFM